MQTSNHAYPVGTYSLKRETTITRGGDVVQITPRPYTHSNAHDVVADNMLPELRRHFAGVRAKSKVVCANRISMHQTSITAGTLFHKTHKPLRTWFLAMWFVTSQKHGASALGLKRVLGLGSYNTAWEWLHKLRRGMVRSGRDQLQGPVEVDETYVGGVGTQVRGRGAERKAIVVIAAEVRGKGPGRIRMAVVPDVSAESLHKFVLDNVHIGSEVRTDGWCGYNGLDGKGYRHKAINIAASGDPAHVVMPRVHRVASLFSRVWLGTHQGAIRSTHLTYYLDEFTFRFNRRNSKSRGLLFYRLMEQAVDCTPAPRKVLVGGNHNI